MQRRLLLRSLVLTPAGLCLPGAAVAESSGVTLAVIVSKTSPLRDLSLADLRRIFMSEPFSDPGGNRVIALNHPARTTDRMAFDQVVLGMDADAVSKFWLDRRIRGQSGAPRTVDSLSMLLGVVANLPGAIGYSRVQHMTDKVTALKIAGVLPGKPGYPLVFAG